MKVGRKKYKARSGFHFSDKDAQIIGERIEYLMKQSGNGVTPKDMVDDARDKSSPLHKFFEWDNTKAGEKWRLNQAGTLYRGVTEVIVHKGEKKEVRSFFNVENAESKKVYVTYEKVIKEPDCMEQLIRKVRLSTKNFLDLLELLEGEYNKRK